MPDTPIVLLTGLNDEELALKAIKEGAQDYLLKDEISPSLLIRAGKYAMERQSLKLAQAKLIKELKHAMENIKTLRGLLPICMTCKKIRDDQGYWEEVDSYIRKNTNTKFSHGFCPNCTQLELAKIEKEIKRYFD